MTKISYLWTERVLSVVLIISIVCSGIMIFLPSSYELSGPTIASTWTQTSASDFNTGTIENLTIEGESGLAELMVDIHDQQHWTQVSPSPRPSNYPNGKQYQVMASIWGTTKVLMFGAWWNNDESWLYDLGNNTWTDITPSPRPVNYPPPNYAQAMASINRDDKVVMFGGRNDAGFNNNTWIYDLSESKWADNTPANPNTTNNPLPRMGCSMARFPGTNKFILFGGYGGSSYFNDTWIYDFDNNTWTNENPEGNIPHQRAYYGLAPIESDDKVILFGGRFSQASNIILYDDTWVYDLSANRWTERTLNTKPPARYSHSLASISGSDEILLFGGYLGGFDLFGDTWIYDPNNGTEGTWNEIPEESLKDRPDKRFAYGLASIPDIDSIVLFGGRDIDWANDETWVYKHFIHPKNGTYLSGPFDTGTNSSFNTISWLGIVPKYTSIEFQLRTAADKANLTLKAFIGPDGTTSTYYSLSPENIWSGHHGDRWIQVLVCFNMRIITEPPVLKSVSIYYNCLPEISALTPCNQNILSNNKPTFTWAFIDLDSGKQKAFQVIIDDDINFTSIDFNSGMKNSADQYWQFPAGTSYKILPDSILYWKVRAKDSDDAWTDYSSPIMFRIDAFQPSSAPTSPIHNGSYNYLAQISGLADDFATGSGLARVEVAIKKLSNNNYWDGSKWVPQNRWLLTTGTTNWVYDSSVIPWASGNKYSVQSRAIDLAGNIEQPAIENIFIFDTEGPCSFIERPTENSCLNELNSISGTALDLGGSEINKMEISIKCSKDYIDSDNGANKNDYWDGSAWTSVETWLPATGTNQWTYDSQKINWMTGDYYTIQSRGTDNTGNKEVPNRDNTFIFDAKSPEKLAIYIDGGEEYCSSSSVILSLHAIDDGSGLAEMAFSNNGLEWTDWEPFNTTRPFDLIGGEGEKKLFFKVRDYAGNVAEPVFSIILFDSIPPENLAIEIIGDTKCTNSNEIELKLQATDAGSGLAEMAISYDSVNWLPWENFKNSKCISFPATAVDGEKVIYFKARDKAGNVAKRVYDTVILDRMPPHSLQIQINASGIENDKRNVTLKLHAIDELSGISQMTFSIDGYKWSTWENFKNEIVFTLPVNNTSKTKIIYFKVKDEAGNVAEPVSAIIPDHDLAADEPSSFEKFIIDNEFSILLVFIIIIMVFVLIIILLLIVRKRLVRLNQELLQSGPLPIKPGMSKHALPTISKTQTNLPPTQSSISFTSGNTQPQIGSQTTSVPVLSKFAQNGQEPSATPAQSQAPKELPRLPPANNNKDGSNKGLSVSEPKPSNPTSKPETTLTNISQHSNGPKVHLPGPTVKNTAQQSDQVGIKDSA
ncbi:Kelch repeat-containing protein, partial [[Eubacterium] cellulosolvens]